jgi:hypothetical protein
MGPFYQPIGIPLGANRAGQARFLGWGNGKYRGKGHFDREIRFFGISTVSGGSSKTGPDIRFLNFPHNIHFHKGMCIRDTVVTVAFGHRQAHLECPLGEEYFFIEIGQ